MRIVNRIKELLVSAIAQLLYLIVLLLLVHHTADADGRQQGYQHHQHSVSPLLATFHFNIFITHGYCRRLPGSAAVLARSVAGKYARKHGRPSPLGGGHIRPHSRKCAAKVQRIVEKNDIFGKINLSECFFGNEKKNNFSFAFHSFFRTFAAYFGSAGEYARHLTG